MTENLKVSNSLPLKPCPFCSSNDLWVQRLRWFFKVTYNVCCPCGVSQFDDYKSEQQAIAAWNKRV